MTWARAVLAALCWLLTSVSPSLAQSDLSGLTGEWRVTRLNGFPPAQGEEATLRFENGQISGKSFCNRYSGRMTATGNTFSVGPVASTRMACPQSLMQKEQTFLQILQSATTALIIADVVTLNGSDGRTITARRITSSRP